MGFLDNLKNTVKQAASNVNLYTKKTYTFDSIPADVSELKARPEADMKDAFGVAALAVCALNIYPINKDIAIEMLNFLKGPAPLSNYDVSFLKDRFSDKDYVPRSYFEGSLPDNDYEPAAPYTIVVKEGAHSKDSEGYFKVWIHSGGADNDREVILRNKPSTGEWFLHEYQGLLASIREPKSANPWA